MCVFIVNNDAAAHFIELNSKATRAHRMQRASECAGRSFYHPWTVVFISIYAIVLNNIAVHWNAFGWVVFEEKMKRRFRFAACVQRLQQCEVLGTSSNTLCQVFVLWFISFLGCGLPFSFVSFSAFDEQDEKKHVHMTGNAESAGVFKLIVHDFKWLWWWSLCVIWHKYMYVLHLNCHKSVDPYLWTVLSSSTCDFRNCLSVCGTGVYFHFA